MTPPPYERHAPFCPACGREAPIVYRGVIPHCTACGAVRVPLSGPSLNLAGKPSRVGGLLATVAGWGALVVGGVLTLGVVLLLLAFNWSMGALAFGLPLGLLTLAVTYGLVRGGRKLNESASRTERSLHAQAIFSLAAHRGAVTAQEAAQALGVGVADADAMLTELAKREPDRIAVDVDDQGVVWYRVASLAGAPLPRVRVDAAAPGEPLEAEADEARKKAAGA